MYVIEISENDTYEWVKFNEKSIDNQLFILFSLNVIFIASINKDTCIWKTFDANDIIGLCFKYKRII